MVAYQHFLALSHSANSDQRGEAAHMVATAFVEHTGPEDERAALYASVLGFLDDPSVKVRACLAFGLLHSDLAPRMVMLALVKDAPIIARAVVQYSPVLIDVDLTGIANESGSRVLMALVERKQISERLIQAIVQRGEKESLARILSRNDIEFSTEILAKIVKNHGSNAKIRGKLFARKELPGFCRMKLVEEVKKSLFASRIVKGAMAPDRLARLMRDALDSATTRIGEEAALNGESGFTLQMHEEDRINTRILLHSLVHGHVLFFADCISLIADMPGKKVFTLLEHGSRVALNALFCQCGMNVALRNLLARLVVHARNVDLSNDDAERFFVVTALIEELIIEHEGNIPQSLEDAFRYLDEQNVILARNAARGVMHVFAQDVDPDQMLLEDGFEQVPGQDWDAKGVQEEQLALPAA
ncbi:MAG: DUF2336 domain-containing protein [Devosiaceae bacterium]|nr:DUF2336 domain-containing protein [Devosiaceae bacterium]